jgi:hypothetical protein
MKRIILLAMIFMLAGCMFALAEEETGMMIHVTDGTHKIVFALNDTPAAKSLYAQLPLEIEVDNYGGNEKIFYPPEKLDGKNAVETGGEAGGLAYFSPWGNVVMYYGAFSQYPGLYVLGEAISGGEQIGQLTGTIRVTALESQKEYKVRITVGETELIATFADNATSQALIEKMPMTLPMMDLYGREMCYRFTGEDIPAEEAQYGSFDVGKILYWTPWRSFVIVYAESGEEIDDLQYVGMIEEGVDVFADTGDIDVTFETIEP